MPSTPPQDGIALSKWHRDTALETLRFRVEQTHARIFATFDNIPDEVLTLVERVRASWGVEAESSFVDEDGDLIDPAVEAGHEFQIELESMQDDVVRTFIADLYHAWERRVREWLRREWKRQEKTPIKIDKLNKADFDDICKILNGGGWDIRACDFFSKLDQLRHVANTVKHGNGPSCRALYEARPDLFPEGRLRSQLHAMERFEPDSDELRVSTQDFDDFSRAVEAFWTQAPVRRA